MKNKLLAALFACFVAVVVLLAHPFEMWLMARDACKRMIKMDQTITDLRDRYDRDYEEMSPFWREDALDLIQSEKLAVTSNAMSVDEFNAINPIFKVECGPCVNCLPFSD